MSDLKNLSENELIKRINELAKKSKNGLLFEEEIKIREALRGEYIRRIKTGLRSHLDYIKPQD